MLFSLYLISASLSISTSFSPTIDKFELPEREPANPGLTAMSQQSISSKTKDSKEPKQLCLKIRGCDIAFKCVIFKLSWKMAIIDEGSCHPHSQKWMEEPPFFQ